MTLAVVFRRKLPNRRDSEELVFASDSRLSGGQCIDYGPKVFELPRSDALIAFAGDTRYAYPFVQHLLSAIRIYPRSVDRRFPLSRARGHFVRVCQQMYESIHSYPAGCSEPLEATPALQILFGGYSWSDTTFHTWVIDRHPARNRFQHKVCGRYHFIGDDDVVRKAIEQTERLLIERRKTRDSLDMEPFEVLLNIIKSNAHASVGGAPQVAKVYRHMNTQFFSVLWPMGDSLRPHVYGRPLLEPETSALPIFDPETLDWTAQDQPWDLYRVVGGAREFLG